MRLPLYQNSCLWQHSLTPTDYRQETDQHSHRISLTARFSSPSWYSASARLAWRDCTASRAQQLVRMAAAQLWQASMSLKVCNTNQQHGKGPTNGCTERAQQPLKHRKYHRHASPPVQKRTEGPAAWPCRSTEPPPPSRPCLRQMGCKMNGSSYSGGSGRTTVAGRRSPARPLV